ENHVDHRKRSVAHAPNGLLLVGRKTGHQARRDEFGRAHENELGGNGGELVTLQVGDANGVGILSDGDYSSAGQHAVGIFRFQDFHQLVADAAKTTGQDAAGVVFAFDEVLRVENADKCGGVFRDRAPVGRAVGIPPLGDFGSLARGDVGEGFCVELQHLAVHIDLHDVVAEFFEAGDDIFFVGKVLETGAPSVWDVGAVVDGGIGHVDE